MAELGSFGPGWFYSVFGIVVEFENATPVVDDGEVFALPWFSFNGQAYLYSGCESVIKGNIKLYTYNKSRDVWHGGIMVSIEEYIHTLDPYVSTQVKNFTTTVAKEDVVKGTATYSFNFPLVPSNHEGQQVVCKEKISPYCTRNWCNNYNGNTFGIRHVFHVTVIRPWYTFNCQKHIFLSLHRMNPKLSLESNQNDGNVLTLNITGLKGSGKCSLKLNSDCLDISRGRDPSSYGRGGLTSGGALSGSIRLHDISDPIISIVIVLIRQEIVGNNITNEKVEFEHTVIGYVDTTNSDTIEEKPRDIPRSRGYWERLDLGDENPRDTDPIKTGSVISFEIPLDGYTNLTTSNDVGSFRGFSIIGDKNSHLSRLQQSMWNNIRIHPTFEYLPLLAPPGEEILDSEEIPSPIGGDLEEIQLNTSSSAANPPSSSIDSPEDLFTVHSVLPEESVSLKYLVRLSVKESSGKHLWEVQEIKFYDSGLSPLPSYIDLIKGSNSSNLEAV